MSFAIMYNSINVGAGYTLAIVESLPAAVVWSSSDPAVITVDWVTGEITAVGEGTAVITATLAETATTAARTITMEIRVNPAPEPPPVED